jgi:hypothetical protein
MLNYLLKDLQNRPSPLVLKLAYVVKVLLYDIDTILFPALIITFFMFLTIIMIIEYKL